MPTMVVGEERWTVLTQHQWESRFGFTTGWLDAVRDLRAGEAGFSRDLTLRHFNHADSDQTTYLAFYLAGYDTFTRGYIPARGARWTREGAAGPEPERFDLHRLGGLAS